MHEVVEWSRQDQQITQTASVYFKPLQAPDLDSEKMPSLTHPASTLSVLAWEHEGTDMLYI